ncbi:Kelch repeat-containing protein [Streptomyces gardneri]|uniref:Kelch repeat-containing protein n=1 Tax=Streptomyces gardneri TaxID=66892 RepID=UPI003683511C
MRTPSPARSRKKWRGRLALATGLAAVAVLVGMLPAAATNGTIWTTLPSMPTPRGGLGSAVAPCPPGQTGACVYAMGGSNSTTGDLATAESYNRLTNAWSTLPAMPTRRNDTTAVAAPCPPGQSGTCVYVIGGRITVFGDGETDVLQSVVESYNPVTNAWSTVSPLRTARRNLAAAAAPCPPGQGGTCIYVVGGTDNGFLNTAEVYSPANNSWSTVAAMPTRRMSLGAAAAACPPGQSGTCVYAVGGLNSAGFSSTVESYNPATNAWSPVASLPGARDDIAMAATNCPPGQNGTCLYAVGGFNQNGDLGTVQSYNPASNLWTDLPPLPTPRSEAAAAAMPCPVGVSGNCVYTSGGFAGSSFIGTVEALDPPRPSQP